MDKVAFPFSFKPSRAARAKPITEFNALEDYGSSLMSARGYDSDAQCMSTPRRADVLGRLPTSRGLQRMELSDLIERSQERASAERWAMSEAPSVSPPQESAFGMRFIPTPPSSLRGVPTPYHTPWGTGDNQAQSAHAQEVTKSPLLSDLKPRFMRSLPSLSSTTTQRGASISNQSQAMIPMTDLHTRTLPTDANKILPPHHGNAIVFSGSLPTPISKLVVPKTRDLSTGARSFTDPQLLNLSEVGIPNRLSPSNQSSAPVSVNQSLAGVIREVQQRIPVAPSDENLGFCKTSTTSVLSVPENNLHMAAPRDASSCYSRGASFSSECSPLDVNSRNQATGNDILIKPEMAGRLRVQSPILNVPDPKAEVYSRFKEHCDTGASPPFLSKSNQPDSSVSPRKVSIGWMSGGRRVGFGYSVVPEAGIEPQCHNESQNKYCEPNFNRPAGWRAEIDITDPGYHPGYKEPAESQIPTEFKEQPSIKEHDKHLAVIANNDSLRQYEATTFPRSANHSQRRNGYAVPPHMRGRTGSQCSREQDPQPIMTDKRISGSPHAPGLIPTVQVEHCEVPRTSHYTSQGNDNFARQWARYSRSTKGQSPVRQGIVPPQDGAFSVDRLDRSDETQRDFLDTEIETELDHEAEDITTELQTSSSRRSRWVRRFSRHWDGRGFSRHQQEASQSSSGNSYHDCDSNSPKRVNSTKSSPPDDLDCLEMPGSFEGSGWASRLSRFL